jgi:hypothetical protein
VHNRFMDIPIVHMPSLLLPQLGMLVNLQLMRSHSQVRSAMSESQVTISVDKESKLNS